MRSNGAVKLLQQQAYEYLSQQISVGNLQNGVIYSETQIAKEVGISRTPMREALLRLSQNKIVDIIPSKGFCLHEMAPEDAEETYQVRAAVEGYAATMISLGCKTERGKQTMQRIGEYIEQQYQLFQQGASNAQITDVDHEMHSCIVAYAQNESLNELFDNHTYRIRKFAIDTFADPKRIEKAIEEHRRILLAMQSNSIEQVYAAVLAHMEAPKRTIMEHLKARRATQTANQAQFAFQQ